MDKYFGYLGRRWNVNKLGFYLTTQKIIPQIANWVMIGLSLFTPILFIVFACNAKALQFPFNLYVFLPFLF